MRIARTIGGALVLACTRQVLVALPLAAQVQDADTVYDARIAHPAFTAGRGPVIAIDEAHRNFHAMHGRYAPFATLIGNDGFRVRPNTAPIAHASLDGVAVLVVANAVGVMQDGVLGPAFTQQEEIALVDWVKGGGSLMLIADHEPMGDAVKRLAARFGVDMSTGRTYDDPHSDWTSGSPSWLVFQRDTGARLGDHAITRGRDSTERVRRVVAFTGQSLRGPPGSTSLLTLAAGAQDRMPGGKDVDASGRSMGLAFDLGKGRVAVFGEAAMFTAQIASAPGRTVHFGFPWPGTDDRQFAINTVRWLARALP